MLLAAPLVLASFASLLFATPTYAADAEWQGDELYYQDHQYRPTDDAPDRDGLANEYQYREAGPGITEVSVIYIGDDPAQAEEATLVTYTLENGDYTNPTGEETISVARNLLAENEGEAQTHLDSTCVTGGLGWIICPVANWIAEGVDWVYGIIENFLEVQTLQTRDNGVYQVWKTFLMVANVGFILIFLVIIYSQLTGAGLSNYSLKDMLPRLFIGAVLVNISFIVCSLAVDASNVLGYGVHSVLASIREGLVTTADTGGLGWSTLTAAILAGGGAAGVAGLAGATAFSGASMSFLLLAILIPVGLSVLVAFIILAARQAIIVVLTIIAPLAFIAFILPGTKKWYDKWQNLFAAMLLFFPLFSLLFGGSQLAGSVIINTSETAQDAMKLPIILVGMAVMVAPLFLTPFLIRFSTGVLGQVAAFANGKKQALAGKGVDWAKDKQDVHRQRKQASSAASRKERIDDLTKRLADGEDVSKWKQRRARRTPLALRMDQKKRDRDADKKESESVLSGMHEEGWNRQLNDPKQANALQQRLGMRSSQQRTSEHHALAARLKHQAENEHNATQAHHERDWQQYLTDNPESRNRRQFEVAHDQEQRSEQYKQIVEGQTKANWQRMSATDSALQGLRLKATADGDDAKSAEQEWNLIIENIRAKGSEGTGVGNEGLQAAQGIQQIHRHNQEMGSAEDVAKSIQQSSYAKSLDKDTAARARATGIGDNDASDRVFARAKSAVSKATLDDAQAAASTMDYDLASDSQELYRQFKNNNVSTSRRLAMVWNASQNGDSGYETAREMISWYAQNGGKNGGKLEDDALSDFKELIKTDSKIPSGDRALELYLNDGGNKKGSLQQFTDNMGTWDIKTSRFAEMGKTRQLEAIKIWQRPESGKKGQDMFNMVRNDIIRTPTLNSAIKGDVKEALGIPLNADGSRDES